MTEAPLKSVVLATKNQGKIVELVRMLESSGLNVRVLGLADFPDMPEVEETGNTFIENALLKAREISAYTGLPALADDSGLCVDALNGDPGIFSARWAGTHGDDQANLEKVLRQLQELDQRSSAGRVDRAARFVSAVALVLPPDAANRSGVEYVEEAALEGKIIDEPIGEHGFGYDPIFQPLGYESTTAQMTPELKDSISHRGQALRKMLPKLAQFI